MVEEDSQTAEQSITLSVVHCHPMSIDFGRSLRTARIERSSLILGRLLNFTEHLTVKGLVRSGYGD